MSKKRKIKEVLVPYFGGKLPKKAQKEAFKRIKENGTLYLLHVTDEAPAKNVRYMTGQLGDDDEFTETFQKSREKLQEKIREDYTEEAKNEAVNKGIKLESLYASGDPVEEVLKAIEKYDIEMVIIESFGEGLREKIAGKFFLDEIDYIRDKTTSEILTVD